VISRLWEPTAAKRMTIDP